MDEEIKILKKGEKEKEEKREKGFFYILFHRVKLSRLAFLLVSLFVTGILLSSSTYAWFTSNYQVSVQKIDVNISSGSGIQISTNARDWKTIITLEDILTNKYEGATNQVPASTDQMNPVSTVKAAFTGATTATTGLKMFKGTIVNDVVNGTQYLDSVQETDGSNSDYIAFDLFLKSDFSTAKQLYLTPGTGVKTQTGVDSTGIEYASRMGFVVNGTVDASSTIANMTAIKGNTPDIYIYEPNYDVHTGTGLANGVSNYGITEGTYQLTGNANAVPYRGVKAAFAYDENTANSGTVLNSSDTNKFTSVTPDILTTYANSDDTAILSLPRGVTKIRVYMWIEGQDIDCENNASGGSITYTLGFKVNQTEQP